MSQLEEIMKIPDEEKRQEKLTEYAESLKINVGGAKKQSGKLNEDELAIMIFDSQRKKSSSRVTRIAVLIFSALFFTAMMTLMFLFMRMAKSGKLF